MVNGEQFLTTASNTPEKAQMQSAQGFARALVKDCRTDHLLDVKQAAKSMGIHPNKTSEWIYRTGEKIAEIFFDQPGAMAAQMTLWVLQAEAKRQERMEGERKGVA